MIRPRFPREREPNEVLRVETPIVRMKCTSELFPGGKNGKAIILDWDWNSSELEGLVEFNSDKEQVHQTITDYVGNCCVLPGDYFTARRFSDTGAWEVLGPYGLERFGKNDALIAPGGSGTVSLWWGGADSGLNV